MTKTIIDDMIKGDRSLPEIEMNISQLILEEARQVLLYEGVAGLPKQIDNSPLFIASGDDDSIVSYGAIVFEEVEYKIGPKKTG